MIAALVLGIASCGSSDTSGPGVVITNDTATATKVIEASIISDPGSASIGSGCRGTDGLLGLYIGSVNSHRCALLPPEQPGSTYRLNLSEIEKDDQSC